MSILGKYESYLGFSQSALDVKARRVQVISENIINASTPNYRAKDIDFGKILTDRLNQRELNNSTPLALESPPEKYKPLPTIAFP